MELRRKIKGILIIVVIIKISKYTILYFRI